MLFDILFLFFSTFYIDYCFQFEEVGSPAAGEAMEEQADTERTEAKRASHTQHAETVRGESSVGTTLGDISLLDRSMYYWAPAVQTPIEQHIDFGAMQPHIFSPPDASHISIIYYYLHRLKLNADVSKFYNTDSQDTGRVLIWTCLITEIIYYTGYRQLEGKYLH